MALAENFYFILLHIRNNLKKKKVKGNVSLSNIQSNYDAKKKGD